MVVDVSVLVTNYNHGKYLPECLDAIFSQSVSPKEVVVIDDASTDGSIALIEEFQKRHSNLVLLRNPVNLGPAKTMNKAIEHAQGKFLVLAAADDQILPGFLEKGAQCLEQNPEIGICCSEPSFFMGEKPYTFFTKAISSEKRFSLIASSEIAHSYLHSPLWIPTHASLYRRELVLKYGCLDEGLKHLCDWYLNCQITMAHGIAYIPESFGAFRLSPHSYGAKWNRSYRKKIELYRHLFTKLKQESVLFKTAMSKAGVLGLISSDVLLYLLLHLSLWKYFPRAFYRKMCNFFRKAVA